MRTLHGTWIPDGLFVYVEEFRRPLPVDGWRQEVFYARDPLLRDVKVFYCKFMMPDFTSAGELKRPQPNPLPTQIIPGLLIPIPSMFSFLLAALDAQSTVSRMRVADDFMFWQRAALFAMELLQRGRAAPTVQRAASTKPMESHIYAVWVPNLDAKLDKQRFLQLAQSVPPFCRAYHPDGALGWVNVPPRDIVLSFLTWGMDAWIRASVTHQQQRSTVRMLEALQSAGLELQAADSAAQAFAEAALKWANGLLDVKGPTSFNVRTSDINRLVREVEDWIAGGRRQSQHCVQTDGRNLVEYTGHENIKTGGRLRLCLRLEVCESGPWILQFLLQSVDDPSLLIPADAIWQSPTSHTVYSGWRFSGIQETLLAELGRASRLYPALEQTLHHPRPTHLEMDVSMAHRFLLEIAEVLQAGGIVVQLPAWWTQKGRQRLGLKMRANQPPDGTDLADTMDAISESRFGLHQLVQFDVVAAVGDTELTPEELQQLAAQKATLVQVRGMWTEVNPDDLQQVVKYLQAGGQGEIELGKLIHLVVEQRSGEGSRLLQAGLLPVVDVELPERLDDLMDGRLRVLDKAVPSGLHGQLRPYQQRGFQWLSTMGSLGFGVCLADDMGLGKTVQIITLLLDYHQQARSSAARATKPALVLCPTSLLGNWQRELSRFAPSIRVYVHHGLDRPRASEFLRHVTHSDLVISTYTLAYRDFEDLSSIRWSHLVLDEAQNIKNSGGKQAQSAYRLPADRRIAMTGTPVENHLTELWSLFHFMNPGYLGSAQEFNRRFAVPIERDRNAEQAKILQRLVAPFVLRRLKTDPNIIQDLPEKIEIKSYCPLTREQASLYEAVVQDVLFQIQHADGIQRRGIILASLTKLKQVCNHPAQFLHDGSQLKGRSGKLTRLLELLAQVREAGEATLVFTLHFVAESRWGRLEPDPCQPRCSLRQMVESGSRKSGDRQGLSDWPTAQCGGAQIHLPRDTGGQT